MKPLIHVANQRIENLNLSSFYILGMDTSSSLGLSFPPPASSVVEFVTDHTRHLAAAVSGSSANEGKHHDFLLTDTASSDEPISNALVPTTVPTPSDDAAAASATASPFQMAYPADVAWTVIFSSMIMSAIIGNLVVFWIVLGKKKVTKKIML